MNNNFNNETTNNNSNNNFGGITMMNGTIKTRVTINIRGAINVVHMKFKVQFIGLDIC